MRGPRTLLSVLLLLLAPPLGAAPLGWIEVPREHAVALRSHDLMVEGGTRTSLRAHATAAERDALSAAGIPFTLLTPDLSLLRPAPTGERGGGYHTPAEISASLRELAATRPDIARVVDLGTSVQGRELTAIVLTDQPHLREPDEPSWRVLGTHHGDEWSSMEVAWAVAWDLAEAYDVDPGVTALLDSSEVWVLPVVNPDGVVAFTRRNSRNVDLNRNYSFEWQAQSFAGTEPFSEPESDAVRVLGMRRSFGHSITMHSGATNIGWVWNWSLAPTDDAALLEAICDRYQTNTADPDFWITNGADWYVTYGDTNDWSYGDRGGHDYTLEISGDKAPPADELQPFIDWHVPATRAFLIDGATTGVTGVVTGPDGPVEATLLSNLAPSAPFFTDPETGVFGRPLSPGTHALTVSAPGFLPTTTTVVVGDIGSGATWATASLAPVAPLAVSAMSGLSVEEGSVAAACLDGAAVVAHANTGGRFLLTRAGLGPWDLDATVTGDCVEVTLDPAVIAEAWTRVGEWTLIFADAAGGAIDQRPLAVAITTPEPTISVDDVSVAAQGGGWLVTISGGDLPEGADLRFMDASGRRSLPLERSSDGTLGAVVDVAGWVEGPVSVRILGGGELVALEDALVLQDGALTSVFSPPGDDDDDTTPPDDDDSGDDDDDDDSTEPADDDDSTEPAPPPPAGGSGCAGCASDPGSGTLALLLLMGPLIGRRRTRIEVPR